MKILHIAPVSNRNAEGLSQSVVNLVEAQQKNGNIVGLISTRKSKKIVNKKIYWYVIFKKNFINILLNDPFKIIISEFGYPDIINFHDIYNLRQVMMLRHALKYKSKVYITPRGSFSSVALRRSKVKKLIFIFFFIRPYLQQISGFVALNKGEKYFINKLFRKKTIIIGNGISNNKKIFNKNLPIYKKKLKKKEITVGFVGRFDIYIKGLDTLLNSYLEYQKVPNENKIKLVFLGEHRRKKNEYDSKIFIKSISDKLNNKNLLRVIPAIYGDKKYKEIAKFDILIQPSRTEGMPNTVLEAMSVGIPCCVSPETNMREIIEESNGGWVINRNILEIKNFFLRLEEYDKDYLSEKGTNGMKYAYKHLLWDNIGKIEYK